MSGILHQFLRKETELISKDIDLSWRLLRSIRKIRIDGNNYEYTEMNVKRMEKDREIIIIIIMQTAQTSLTLSLSLSLSSFVLIIHCSWQVLLTVFSVRPAAVFWSTVSRICSKWHAASLCTSHVNFFSKRFVNVLVVQPYTSTDTTTALKNSCTILLEKLISI